MIFSSAILAMAAMTPPPDLEEPPNDILLDPRMPPDGVSVWHDDGPSHELPDGFDESEGVPVLPDDESQVQENQVYVVPGPTAEQKAEHEAAEAADPFRARREAANNVSVVRDVEAFLQEPSFGHETLEGLEDDADVDAEEWMHIEPHLNESRLERSRRWSYADGYDRAIGYMSSSSGKAYESAYYHWRVGNNGNYASRNENTVMGFPASSKATNTGSKAFTVHPGSTAIMRVDNHRVAYAYFQKSSLYWLFELDGRICTDTQNARYNGNRVTYRNNYYCTSSCDRYNWRTGGSCGRDWWRYSSRQDMPFSTLGYHRFGYYNHWSRSRYANYNSNRQQNYGIQFTYNGWTYPCGRNRRVGAGSHTLTEKVYTRGHCGGPAKGGRIRYCWGRWWRRYCYYFAIRNRINKLDYNSRAVGGVGHRWRWWGGGTPFQPRPSRSGYLRLVQRRCVAGWYRLNRGSNCRACESGKYSTSTRRLGGCNVCPNGKRSQKSSGSTLCVTCPSGTRGGSPPTDKCYDCQPGTYTALANRQVCMPCQLGKYNNRARSTSCYLCAAGYYRGAGMVATRCEACAKGKYQNQRGKTSCLNCAPGTAAGTTAATTCPACQPGTVAPRSGQAICDDCEPGQEQPKPRQTLCIDCQPGKYAAQPRTPTCSSCSAADDEYNDQVKSVACTPHQICDTASGFLEKKGTITSTSSGRVCGLCEYAVEFLDKTTNYCKACTTSCPAGQTIIQSCTLTEDAVCGPLAEEAPTPASSDAGLFQHAGSLSLWAGTAGYNVPDSEVMNGIPVRDPASPADVCIGGHPVSQTYRSLSARLDEAVQALRVTGKMVANKLPGSEEVTCPEGHFGLSGCSPCASCGPGMVMVQGCTDFHDRVCELAANCQPDAAVDPSSTSMETNAASSLLLTAEADEYHIGLGTAGAEFNAHHMQLDTQIKELDVSLQRLVDGGCGYDETGPNCAECTACPTGHYQTGACDASSDRSCAPEPSVRDDLLALARRTPRAGGDEGKLVIDSADGGDVYVSGLTAHGWDNRYHLTARIKALGALLKVLKKARDLPVPASCCAV
jgi:hypothetical protein